MNKSYSTITSALNRAQNFESTLEHFGNQYHTQKPMI